MSTSALHSSLIGSRLTDVLIMLVGPVSTVDRAFLLMMTSIRSFGTSLQALSLGELARFRFFMAEKLIYHRIIPWNGPLASVGLKATPALAAGCVFILKPSEKTPLMAAALGKLIIEAGFPPGVFQVLMHSPSVRCYNFVLRASIWSRQGVTSAPLGWRHLLLCDLWPVPAIEYLLGRLTL